ncbi:PHP domain-containing protein [Motiliproteus sp. SC1-56]|uniref:PHP domain-containing protein n=1 Tax=Motiliproteus sp. SC1-56 TaxID=2799565 RepID=UPI001A8F11B9|nr:PHP domain-containing protein [Motiliproteus sp. SC1-56]
MPATRVDLHTHSTASDGGLAPKALVRLAHEKEVTCLALTDHDTCAGLAEARLEAAALGMTLIDGIELSSTWGPTGVHVVGLDIDPEHPAMQAAVSHQRTARALRAEAIEARLSKRGLNGVVERAQVIAGASLLGRPHMARAMVELGYVADEQDAFKRYLGAGKAGDIRAHWPDLHTVVGWIRDAGGVAVLAHPGKYGLTWSKLRALVADFIEVGGEAMEVSYGGENRDRINELVRLANRLGLKASVGSDFHRPEHTWTDLGKYPPFSGSCTPVWSRWIEGETQA